MRRIIIIGAICLICGLGGIAAFLIIPPEYPRFASENEAVNGEVFNKDVLLQKAYALSQKSYQAPPEVSNDLKKLNYDQYRDIRFVRENGPWYGQRKPFEIQFFHPGALFHNEVMMNEIVHGKSRPIGYSPFFFNFGKNKALQSNSAAGYAGFRLHYPLNNELYYDELISFLGASYFRALGRGQKYGLSARGLAIDTGLETGEEFPIFREFWIEKPKRWVKSIQVYALLDSPSVVGAYTFLIRPGSVTTIDVDAVLFTRKKINKLGIAPLTSMYLFGENTKNRFDDHRPEVHDSDGLLVWNQNDEVLWRPLDNSKYLRISAFEDTNPKGFGLMQRDIQPGHYLDFEAYYELRPSAWVEPLSDWGKGHVELVEIPSNQEIHDNVVAFWVPDGSVEAGQKLEYTYRIYWSRETPVKTKKAPVTATYTGIGGVSGMLETHKRKFVIDFDLKEDSTLKDLDEKRLTADVSASTGKILGSHIMVNPVTGGVTLYFDFKPDGKTAELRAVLRKDGEPVTEVWSYQWLP